MLLMRILTELIRLGTARTESLEEEEDGLI